ncbi:MAG: hypothetical protein QXD70_01795 [Candidatus Bathyarchaeia archaeon]
MPKTIIMVEKDASGKLWNYFFNEIEFPKIRTLTRPTKVHFTGNPPNNFPNQPIPTPEETDGVTIGMLPLEEIATTSQQPKRQNTK